MLKGYTYIGFILDRSGSMEGIRQSTISGYNEFLHAQAQIEGRCDFRLVQFDNLYELHYDGAIATAPRLTQETYVPRGGTALLDAIGRTIVEMGAKFEAMPDAARPEKVLIVILTDGQENSSRNYRRSREIGPVYLSTHERVTVSVPATDTRPAILDMIRHQQDAYRWQFIYLGANQDAISEAASYGIYASNAANFAANAMGTGSTYTVTNSKVTQFRAMDIGAMSTAEVSKVMGYSDDERNEMDDTANTAKEKK